MKITHCIPACPGATGCGYTTVLIAYECFTFHHRILAYQVWARVALLVSSIVGRLRHSLLCLNLVHVSNNL